MGLSIVRWADLRVESESPLDFRSSYHLVTRLEPHSVLDSPGKCHARARTLCNWFGTYIGLVLKSGQSAKVALLVVQPSQNLIPAYTKIDLRGLGYLSPKSPSFDTKTLFYATSRPKFVTPFVFIEKGHRKCQITPSWG
jgi:hypothetical protein